MLQFSDRSSFSLFYKLTTQQIQIFLLAAAIINNVKLLVNPTDKFYSIKKLQRFDV